MNRALILRRQMPFIHLFISSGLIIQGTALILTGSSVIWPVLGMAIAAILLRNAIANLKSMRVEVNDLGIYDNGLLIVESKDVAKAEAIGSALVVHTRTNAKYYIPAFDISRKGRRQFVAVLNDHAPQPISDEAQRTAHVQ